MRSFFYETKNTGAFGRRFLFNVTMEATVRIEPTNSGFADRRVNHFAMWPKRCEKETTRKVFVCEAAIFRV